MIKSFRGKHAEAIFKKAGAKGFPADLIRRAQRALVQIDGAATLDELTIPPGNRLELLRGDRAGQYSIRINDQWRVCFEWQGQDAWLVEIVDYH
jgi:proteic killer suppression protein